MRNYMKFDRGNGIIDITYESNNFVFSGNLSEGQISTPQSEVVYRGNIHIDNDDWGTAHINLINYNSNHDVERRVMISEMKMLPDDMIALEKKSIKLNSIPLGTHVQIVEFNPYSDYDTNSIEIDVVINSNLFIINLPEDSTGKEYIIWVGNMCKKISL